MPPISFPSTACFESINPTFTVERFVNVSKQIYARVAGEVQRVHGTRKRSSEAEVDGYTTGAMLLAQAQAGSSRRRT